MYDYSTLLRVRGLELHDQIQFSVISRTLFSGGGSYLSEEMQTAYSTVPTDWAADKKEKIFIRVHEGQEERTH